MSEQAKLASENTTLQVFTVVIASKGGTTETKLRRLICQYVPGTESVVVERKGESTHSLPKEFT